MIEKTKYTKAYTILNKIQQKICLAIHTRKTTKDETAFSLCQAFIFRHEKEMHEDLEISISSVSKFGAKTFKILLKPFSSFSYSLLCDFFPSFYQHVQSVLPLKLYSGAVLSEFLGACNPILHKALSYSVNMDSANQRSLSNVAGNPIRRN